MVGGVEGFPIALTTRKHWKRDYCGNMGQVVQYDLGVGASLLAARTVDARALPRCVPPRRPGEIRHWIGALVRGGYVPYAGGCLR